jgi:uncharacterized protein YeaO (DUF488 family)
MDVLVKRVYEAASRLDGLRVLVDRLWPRGLAKEDAAVKLWLGKRRVTLLYASLNEEYNNAVVLKELLDGMPKPPSSVGRIALGRQRIRNVKRQ